MINTLELIETTKTDGTIEARAPGIRIFPQDGYYMISTRRAGRPINFHACGTYQDALTYLLRFFAKTIIQRTA